MIELARGDCDLRGLVGVEVASERLAGVRYHLAGRLGGGAFAVTFLAKRRSPAGESAIVLKVMRPGVVRGNVEMASVMFRKEAVALARLDERVPPTPFVVRSLEVGALAARQDGVQLGLPWIAMEYVHGGPEGTTLQERVLSSLERTGHAFGRERLATAVECLCLGLSAVHDVGVLHRDLTPGNVLCSGWGDSETFKIADFGLARPAGVDATFGAVPLGTPGYAAPEQAGATSAPVTSWTDVFSLGAILYFAGTGRQLFDEPTPARTLAAPLRPERRSLADSRFTAPDLADCVRALDEVIAAATAADPRQRPASALALMSLALGALRSARGVAVDVAPRRRPVAPPRSATDAWTHRVAQTPERDLVILGAAWDGPARCLAATTAGLRFWDGFGWRAARVPWPDAAQPRAVHRVGPGRWLVAGTGGVVVAVDGDGSTRRAEHPSRAPIVRVSGDPSDLAACVLEPSSAPTRLGALAAGRWVRAIPLDPSARVTGIERIDAERWLVTGRQAERGAVWIYEPLAWEATRVLAADDAAVLAGSARSEVAEAVVVGTQGFSAWIARDGRASERRADERCDLDAVALDPTGRAWAAGCGTLLTSLGGGPWARAWSSPSAREAPIAIVAEPSIVRVLTQGGGVIEGTTDG
jgi:serine/threonine protein kinase